jgi:hypothetical protein
MLKEHQLGQHPKQRRLPNRHHQTSGLKKPELDEEQIEERDQNRSNKGQPTTSPDEHTNCKDMKIIYRSGGTNSHWPFANIGKNTIEVGRGRRDIIL